MKYSRTIRRWMAAWSDKCIACFASIAYLAGMDKDTDIAIAVDAETATGMVVWWNGCSFNRVRYQDARDRVGLADAPEPSWMGEKAALKAAAEEIARHLNRANKCDTDTKRTYSLRKLARAVGFEIVVDEATDEASTQVRSVLRLRHADKLGDAFAGEDIVVDGELAPEFAQTAHDAYRSALDSVDSMGFANWARCIVVERLNGTPIQPGRQNGGWYYIPAASVPAMEDYRQLMAGVGGRLCRMAASRSEDLLDTLFTTVKREADSALDALEEDVLENDLSARSVALRQAQLAALLARMEGLGEVLGDGLQGIRERCERLDVAYGELEMGA